MSLLQNLHRDLVHGHARLLDRLRPQRAELLPRGLGILGDDLVLGSHAAVLDDSRQLDVVLGQAEGDPPPALSELVPS